MPTECNPDVLLFAPVEGRAVVASFTGGAITSDAGALLLGATDRAIGLVERPASRMLVILTRSSTPLRPWSANASSASRLAMRT
jgi:hypothetical protein